MTERADRLRRELWRGPGDQVYAILDAARDERIYPALARNPDGCACLYSTDPTGVLAKVAPYLVGIEPDAPFTQTLLREGWGHSWGVFVRTPLDLERARRHFKRFLRARTEDGKSVVFRYYDPRVLRVYLPTCTEAELYPFFGEATDLVMEGETPDALLSFSRGPLGFSCTRLDLAEPEAPAPAVAEELGTTIVVA